MISNLYAYIYFVYQTSIYVQKGVKGGKDPASEETHLRYLGTPQDTSSNDKYPIVYCIIECAKLREVNTSKRRVPARKSFCTSLGRLIGTWGPVILGCPLFT